MEVASQDFADFNVGDSFSFSWWMLKSDHTNDEGFIVKTSDAERGILIYTNGVGGVNFNVKLIDVWETDRFGMTYADGINRTGLWTNYVITYDGTGTSAGVKLYTNGDLTSGTSEDVGTATNISTHRKLHFGAWLSTGTYQYPSFSHMDEIGIWNRTLSPTEASTLYDSGSGTFYSADATDPTVTLNTPIDNTKVITLDNYFSSSYTTTQPTFANSTLEVWYSNGSLFNQNFSVVNNSLNTSNLSLSFNVGEYLWNYEVCTDLTCNHASSNRTFSVNAFTENTIAFNTSSLETNKEKFELNVTMLYTPVSIASNLVYNGTSYSATPICTGAECIITSEIDVPVLGGSILSNNNTFYFNITFTNATTITSSTNTYGQNASRVQFGFCNGTLGQRYLNISFKDESDSSRINASIPASTFVYYLGSGAINKSLTFVNNSQNWEYDFCGSPNDTILKVYPFVQYKQYPVYPQRTWNPSVQTYANISNNQTLYLLGAEGGDKLFQVLSSNDQLLSGVKVTATRELAGVTVTVGEGTTGEAGTVSLWLNRDFVHTITFEKEGYATETRVLAPTEPTYTVILGGSAGTSTPDYTQVNYNIFPKGELFNDTTYDFEFNVDTPAWDVALFGFTLRLLNGSIVNNVTSSTEGTPATLSYDVNNQTKIYMDYYWIINGNSTVRSTKWIVTNTEYTQWSIKNFFTDLKLYLNAGMFGLDAFGRILIVFIVLFLTVGIMSYKYGITSPMAITAMIFIIVYFFDYVAELIPTINGISHLPTFIVGLILALQLVREAMK